MLNQKFKLQHSDKKNKFSHNAKRDLVTNLVSLSKKHEAFANLDTHQAHDFSCKLSSELMRIEGSKCTLLEDFRFNKIEKKRKSDNRLSLSVSTIIAVVLRGLQIFSIHFSSHPSDTQQFNQTKSTFSYVNVRLLQKAPKVRPNCSAPPGRGGCQVSATCTLKKRSHLHPQKEISLAPSKRASIAPSNGRTFGPF